MEGWDVGVTYPTHSVLFMSELNCEEGGAGWSRRPGRDGQGLGWLGWRGGVGKAGKAGPVPPGLLTSDPAQTGSAISVGPDPRGEGMHG